MRGYYKRPDLSKEVLTDDGWFKSGDVARILKDGTFAITDRAKNLVKLAHGEYIALESLESNYRNSSKIKNICIVANSDKSFIVAVVEPADNSATKAALLKELQETAKKSDCARVEIIKDIIVTRDDDWSQRYLTTSGKLKRKDLHEAYRTTLNGSTNKNRIWFVILKPACGLARRNCGHSCSSCRGRRGRHSGRHNGSTMADSSRCQKPVEFG